MTTLTERAAELLIASHAFDPAAPGFVGASLELPVAAAPSHRVPLRHGFLDARSARVAVVSGPPSPGLAACLARMSDDLAATSAAGFTWPTAPAPLARQSPGGSPRPHAGETRAHAGEARPHAGEGRPHAGETRPGRGDGQTRAGAARPRVGDAGTRDGEGLLRARLGEAPAGAGGIRVALEAGLDAGGPLGLERR
ncbi:hypothetical protein ACQP2X_22325 [Actinoplanes sp. CA-131856]